MKTILLLGLFIILISCSKPKTVLICGDHVCVNKQEAQQYFEENLSLEVKILNNKKTENIDLVELNLSEKKNKKIINVKNKQKTKKTIRKLTKDEINLIKTNVKDKKKKKLSKKKLNKIMDDKTKIVKKNANEDISLKKDKNFFPESLRKSDVVDICTIIKKCNIEEISKYLIKEGAKKDFPNIGMRQ